MTTTAMAAPPLSHSADPRETAPRLADIAASVRAEPTAIALLAAVAGSTPREKGAWMIVTGGATRGTIGGGEAERRTVEAARRLLSEGGRRETLDLPLNPTLDQCCGGRMTIEIARIDEPPDAAFPLYDGGPLVADPPRRPVIVYGAGHVGTALVAALAPLPFALDWVDAREATLWPAHGPVACRRIALPETVAMAAPPETVHLVMTHSHAVDLEIVAAALSRPFAFLGLIGTATKRAIFTRRLAERGLDAARLTCPIGLPFIDGKEPSVIAASVAAQLLALDRGERR
ncbi:xanthine dehydrogenase accessory protein XdhC [Acuticoccus sp. M5D2P5]|uniref:xanthine dehydrogenase accessory protein XdhC n=1 Tax=Acuticoccus kalidii TaxID=2910977 RepID=UPI001F2D4543|nr:xanthine dehydrogenase accessory protein XdhC [Acuticoccus kalidii]MCF3933564.1 xanthine dehydrogenase accessory protein XdhC [Acuticoccus kalidii]